MINTTGMRPDARMAGQSGSGNLDSRLQSTLLIKDPVPEAAAEHQEVSAFQPNVIGNSDEQNDFDEIDASIPEPDDLHNQFLAQR